MGFYGGYWRRIKDSTTYDYRWGKPGKARHWRSTEKGIPVLGAGRRLAPPHPLVTLLWLLPPAVLMNVVGFASLAANRSDPVRAITPDIGPFLCLQLAGILAALSLSATAPRWVRALAFLCCLPYPACQVLAWCGA